MISMIPWNVFQFNLFEIFSLFSTNGVLCCYSFWNRFNKNNHEIFLVNFNEFVWIWVHFAFCVLQISAIFWRIWVNLVEFGRFWTNSGKFGRIQINSGAFGQIHTNSCEFRLNLMNSQLIFKTREFDGFINVYVCFSHSFSLIKITDFLWLWVKFCFVLNSQIFFIIWNSLFAVLRLQYFKNKNTTRAYWTSIRPMWIAHNSS